MDGHRPSVASRQGVVAAAHPLAAAAGARLLGKGGNAFDAAVAAAAAFGVVAPYAAGLGGVGTALCFVAADQRLRVLDYQGRAPAGFPTLPPVRASRSAVAPTCLAGWYNLLSAHGTKTLAEVLAPAIAFARDGAPLTGPTAAGFTAALTAQPGLAAWLGSLDTGGKGFHAGAVLRQPALAATLEAIAASGPRHLHGGPLGRQLAAEVQARGGSLTQGALAAVDPDWGRPVSADSRGCSVHLPCPPVQALDVLLGLCLLDDLDLGAGGADPVPLLREAARLATAARRAGSGSGAELASAVLAETTVAALRARLADGNAAVEAVPAQPTAFLPANTLAVADAAGNVVCLSESLGSIGGCGIVAPESGFCLNDALAHSALPPVADGPLSLPLLPLIATRGRHPTLALAAGADTVRLLQVLTRRLHFGLPLGEALEAAAADLGRLGGVRAVALDATTRVATGATDAAGEGWAASA
jgi:gamma-glutamyltranspeptidase/glutathione hydrolase